MGVPFIVADYPHQVYERGRKHVPNAFMKDDLAWHVPPGVLVEPGRLLVSVVLKETKGKA